MRILLASALLISSVLPALGRGPIVSGGGPVAGAHGPIVANPGAHVGYGRFHHGGHFFGDPFFWGPWWWGWGLGLGLAYEPYYYAPGTVVYYPNPGAQSPRTEYYGGHWWWWDPATSRWLFAYGGNWWWKGPGGELYYYSDGSYVPAAPSAVTQGPASPAPPAVPAASGATAPAAASVPAGLSVRSPDGRRLVEVSGDTGQAFLYDIGPDGRAAFRKALAPDVVRVRITPASGGRPALIYLYQKGGGTAVYDEDGAPYSAQR